MFLSLIVSIYGFIKSALPVRKAIVDDYPFKLCYIFTANYDGIECKYDIDLDVCTSILKYA